MLSCRNHDLDIYKLVLYSDIVVAYAWMLETCDVTRLLYVEFRNQPVVVIAV